jgi:hypothetical protein
LQEAAGPEYLVNHLLLDVPTVADRPHKPKAKSQVLSRRCAHSVWVADGVAWSRFRDAGAPAWRLVVSVASTDVSKVAGAPAWRLVVSVASTDVPASLWFYGGSFFLVVVGGGTAQMSHGHVFEASLAADVAHAVTLLRALAEQQVAHGGQRGAASPSEAEPPPTPHPGTPTNGSSGDTCARNGHSRP